MAEPLAGQIDQGSGTTKVDPQQQQDQEAPPPPKIDLYRALIQSGLTPEQANAALANLTDTSTTKPVDPVESAGRQIYFDVWGVDPPKGYIEALVKQGLNVAEIRLHELAKPWAERTVYWRDRFAQYASSIAQTLARR